MLQLFLSAGRDNLQAYSKLLIGNLLRLRLSSRLTFTMPPVEFLAEYDCTGRASCKGCRQKLDKKELRIAKVVSNPFGDSGETMNQWYHPKCIFNSFLRARATTRIIQSASDIYGYDVLEEDDQDSVAQMITGKICIELTLPIRMLIIDLNIYTMKGIG